MSAFNDLTVNIDNSVFWGNAGSEGAQIYATGDAPGPDINVLYSYVKNVSADDDIYGNVTFGDGCIGTDAVAHNPAFVNSSGPAYDYSLEDTSPCVESGNDDLVGQDEVDLDQDKNVDEPTPYDLGGSARILGTVDMGAYEAILPMLIDSNPPDQGTLWRSQNNIMRLTFSDDITTPGAGHVTIKELLPDGAFGPDLSANFTFAIESDGGNPRILKIDETTSILEHRKWYAIQNEGDWEGVATFELQLVVQVGDCDGNGIVISLDVGCVNAAIPCFTNCGDDARPDIDGDGRIISLDVGVVNAHIGSFAVTKPSGH